MTRVSKLKVQLPFGNQDDIICELADAKSRLNFDSEIVVVAEGQVVKSFDELIEIANREDLKEKGFVEVKLFPLFSGG
jgi:hypothetical protein